MFEKFVDFHRNIDTDSQIRHRSEYTLFECRYIDVTSHMVVLLFLDFKRFSYHFQLQVAMFTIHLVGIVRWQMDWLHADIMSPDKDKNPTNGVHYILIEGLYTDEYYDLLKGFFDDTSSSDPITETKHFYDYWYEMCKGNVKSFVCSMRKIFSF